MQQKEECIRNFRAATPSESLRQLTCACCTEDVNCSERKVVSIDDIDVSLKRDCTDRIFNTGQYILPDPPFADRVCTDHARFSCVVTFTSSPI